MSYRKERKKVRYEPSENKQKHSSFKHHHTDAFKSSESLTKHPSITSLYSSTDKSRRSRSFDFSSQLSYSLNPGISKRVHSPQPEPLFRRNSLIFSPARRKSIDLSVPQTTNYCHRENGTIGKAGNKEGKASNTNYNSSTIGRDIHIKVDRQLAPWEYSIFKYNPLHYDSSDTSDKQQLTSKKSSGRGAAKQKHNNR